jgi:hypothetical protein
MNQERERQQRFLELFVEGGRTIVQNCAECGVDPSVHARWMLNKRFSKDLPKAMRQHRLMQKAELMLQ